MIITADWHMDKVGDSIMVRGVPSQVLDIRIRARELVAAAEQDDERVIVIAGDIFNKVNPTTEMLGEFFEFLTECRARQISVYLIPGNHDCGTTWANLSMLDAAALESVTVVTDIEDYDFGGCDVLFVPHLPLRKLEIYNKHNGSLSGYIADRYPEGLDVIIGHGMVRGVSYSNDIFFEAGNAMEFDIGDLPNFNLMVLGHIHDYTEITGDHGPIVYPGSPRITNFGEVEEEKGYIALTDRDNWEWRPFEKEITPYVDLVIDLVNKDEIDLSPANVKEIAEGAVVKIKVHARDRIQVDEPKIRRAFNKVGRVTRFETIIGSKITESETKAAVTPLSHEENLVLYLKKMTAKSVVKHRVFDMGKEIIQEVLNAQ